MSSVNGHIFLNKIVLTVDSENKKSILGSINCAGHFSTSKMDSYGNMNPQSLSDNSFIDIYFEHCGAFIGGLGVRLFLSEKSIKIILREFNIL